MPLYGEKKREYQKKWLANRRLEYFKDKKCVKCSSTEDLQLDHIDPKLKESPIIWSCNLKIRNKEIEKCQVLCQKCHREKTKVDLHNMNVGIPNLQARKLTKIQIKEIRENKNNLTERKLAKKYKISRTTIWKIKQNWVYVEI